MSNMVIRTNVLSLNSHRNLGMTGVSQARASARLSSGFRINSAADDAAGLGISEKMRAQIRGLNQASRNAQDGISLIQTAEGAMQSINDMVVRIRELTIQAANDTNVHETGNVAQSDRARIQDEINQLMDEIDAVTLRTEFNTRTLLDGSLGSGRASGRIGAHRDIISSDISFHGAGDNMSTTLVDSAALVTWLNNDANITLLQGGITPSLFATGVAGRALLDTLLTTFGVVAGTTFTINSDVGDLASGDSATITTLLNQGQEGWDWLMTTVHEGGAYPINATDVPLTQLHLRQAAGAIEWFNANRDRLFDIRGPVAQPIRIDLNQINLNSLGPQGDDADVTAIANWLNEAGVTPDTAVSNVRLALITSGINEANVGQFTGLFTALGVVGAVNANTINPEHEQFNSQHLAAVNWFNSQRHIFEAVFTGGIPRASGDGLWFQIGANHNQGVTLNIEAVDVISMDAFSRGDAQIGFNFAALRNDGNIDGRGVMQESGEAIQNFVTAIDSSLSLVTQQRSLLGAMQNRLEFTIENLDIASENLSAANSRIRDTDMAREMMMLTQMNVLQQAATAMLAQANQAPQMVLQLLG